MSTLGPRTKLKAARVKTSARKKLPILEERIAWKEGGIVSSSSFVICPQAKNFPFLSVLSLKQRQEDCLNLLLEEKLHRQAEE